jgi:UDP-glucuronate 4-epimerase
MRETFASARQLVVIHLAVIDGGRPSIGQTLLYEHMNLNGIVNFLELCRELRVSKLIFGSLSSVYGASSKAPYSEE